MLGQPSVRPSPSPPKWETSSISPYALMIVKGTGIEKGTERRIENEIFATRKAKSGFVM